MNSYLDSRRFHHCRHGHRNVNLQLPHKKRQTSATAAPLRVAVIDEELPYPLDSGKRIRTFNLIRRLAERHRITFIAHQQANVDDGHEAVDHFHKLGVRTLVIDRRPPAKSGPFFWARLLRNTLSSIPYSVETHASRTMLRFLKQFATSEAIDLWHCEWTPYAELFRRSDVSPLVISAHNVESLIWQRYSETEGNPAKRWYIRHQLRKFREFERWAFRRATTTVTVSEEDATLARVDFDAKSIDVVENGVDFSFFSRGTLERDPRRLLFLGSLDWRPNLDGIGRFLTCGFPRVLAQEPETRLSIVGRSPPSWLAELCSRVPNVELFANVPSVKPYLDHAGIMIVPLRVGGGSRLKILEAAASQLPVIATPVGAEGLRLTADRHYMSADSIETMNQQIVEGIRNYARLQGMADAARRYALEFYDWDALAEKLDRIWRRCTLV